MVFQGHLTLPGHKIVGCGAFSGVISFYISPTAKREKTHSVTLSFENFSKNNQEMTRVSGFSIACSCKRKASVIFFLLLCFDLLPICEKKSVRIKFRDLPYLKIFWDRLFAKFGLFVLRILYSSRAELRFPIMKYAKAK